MPQHTFLVETIRRIRRSMVGTRFILPSASPVAEEARRSSRVAASLERSVKLGRHAERSEESSGKPPLPHAEGSPPLEESPLLPSARADARPAAERAPRVALDGRLPSGAGATPSSGGS